MNLARIDELVEGSEPDRVYLTEVAKRVDALWGHVRDEGALGAAIGFLSITTVVFRDGFKINDGLDINKLLNVTAAAAVMAAVWDWLGLDGAGLGGNGAAVLVPEKGAHTLRSMEQRPRGAGIRSSIRCVGGP
ncbi:hypothetical protein [Corallococcus exiguus]|uniref:hypothetical protein n=1 Tax=Corallococcus exiguus TaxID=83462 RepID=UPI00155FB48A|nr:hypothetical protein [Corallococcus exiguus]NRD46948.1 hypothetical protein [Corallococcus exiguus]